MTTSRSLVLSALYALSALSLCALASAAHAQQTVCHEDALDFELTNFTRTLSVPQFDPALGTLTAVALDVFGDVRGASRVESLDASVSQVQTRFAADMTVVQDDIELIILMVPIANFMDSFTAFDGTLDFGGSSGATRENIEAGDEAHFALVPTDDKFSRFLGTGTIPFVATAEGNSSSVGSGNLSVRFETAARVRIRVCYTFTGGANTPPSVDCPGSLNASVGVPVQFQVCATDPDVGDLVTLNGVLPAGAVANPPFPVIGNPACTTISWTPLSSQLGAFDFAFTANDVLGAPATCATVVTSAECHMVFGLGGGTSSATIFGHLYDTQLARVRLSYPVTMIDHPSFPLRVVPPVVTVQVLMYNPMIFPSNPSQWSRALTIVRGPDQTLTSSYAGTENGIAIQAELFQQDGRTRLRFPFVVTGL